MATSYHIKDPSALYFLTLTVIGWVDIFSRKIYRDMIIDNLDYCRKNKGLLLYAYVIDQKINYIHNNPVKASFVSKPEDYICSSAGFYSGMNYILEIDRME